MIHPLYHYTAVHLPPRLRERPDADTMRARVDLGMNVEHNTLLRLARIDAVELSSPTGVAARDYMRAFWPFETRADIKSQKRDLYGRWISEVWVGYDHVNLSDALVAAGYAIYKEY